MSPGKHLNRGTEHFDGFGEDWNSRAGDFYQLGALLHGSVGHLDKLGE